MTCKMEEWRDTDYPGYEISTFGRVRRGERILKQSKNGNGYHMISKCYNGKSTSVLVHRLIAKAFIPNPENKSFIDHINRIRTDNRIGNLRWATRHENQQNTSTQKNNQLGLQYISPASNGYQVQIKRYGELYYEWFKTLDEAIEARDLILEYL